jgi:hypothetical protein
MTKGRDLPFGIEIGPAHANWLDFEVRLGDHHEQITASGVTSVEPVRGLLLLGSLALSERNETGTVQFWCEPSGFWLVADMQLDRVEVELTFTGSMFAGAGRSSHNAPERSIASCTLGRVPFALAIWRSVRRAESLLRDACQREEWRHDLPAQDLDALRRELTERGALRGSE